MVAVSPSQLVEAFQRSPLWTVATAIEGVKAEGVPWGELSASNRTLSWSANLGFPCLANPSVFSAYHVGHVTVLRLAIRRPRSVISGCVEKLCRLL